MSTPYHPEPRHEPARAFAAVSRAVRLTLALHERMEAPSIALCDGQMPAIDAGAMGGAHHGNGAVVNRAAAEAALDDAAGGVDSSRETLRERESERFDEPASGSLDDWIAAIRADLGLDPGDDTPSTEDRVDAALGNVLGAAFAPSASHDAPGSTLSIASTGAWARYPPDTE